MKIKDIVSINDRAVLSNAIQLAWYGDDTKNAENDRLVSGYVFGNSINRRVGSLTESSSLPIFAKIRDAFGNPQASNIFTVIASYGHGKSHFALVLANYFGLAPDSPVIAEITNHIETCSDKPTADQFRFFKKQTTRPQLVITLAGHQFQDLRQGFLQALRLALDSNEATRGLPIKSVSVKAAEWLKNLSGEQLEKADSFLSENHDTDVDSLIAALDNFESGKEIIVKTLSRELLGITADFGADVNLKEIIKDTIDTLCTGADAPFHKMLILFDELGVYAEKWCHHPTASGGLAPQEIFEACADRPGKICFIGFVQRELSEFVKNYSPEVQAEFNKWAGRMQPDAVYHLISNLEEVISKLIIKKPEWDTVINDFAPRLLDESGLAHESIQRYHENWEAKQFYTTVTRDCFPLHPLTTGLLCSFNFTQGSRTIIGAIDSMVKSAQENSVCENGKLKWIRPIELVEQFKSDFDESRDFASLEHAVNNALTTDAEPILIDVLKALFLFRETKMTKQNKYEHAELLAHLAGYTLTETKGALETLQEDFDAVRYSAQRREYEFTGATSTRTIVLDMARNAIVGKRVDGFVKSLEKLKAFENLIPQDSEAREFKADFAVVGDEWFLAPRYLDAAELSPEEVKKICNQTINEGKARGTVIYLISGSGAELDEMREYADTVFNKLKEEDYAHPFVIGIPGDAAVGLEKQILMKDFIVHGMLQPDKVQFADSHRAALDFTDKELNDALIAHIRTVEYKVPNEINLKFGNRQKPLDEIADALFEIAYKFRAPSNSVSMKPSANPGNTATAMIARQMIVNELNFESFDTAKQNIIKQVLLDGTNRWGILDDKYKIKDPKDLRVMQAWSFLRNNVSKDGWTSFDILMRKLTHPPFGYDDYTATFLIAAWIGKHKHELAFKDSRRQTAAKSVGNPSQSGVQANLKLGELQNNLDKSKDFIKFLRANVAVQNSGHEIQKAAKEYLEQLRTVTDIMAGKELFAQAGQVLQTLAATDDLVSQIKEALGNLADRLAEAERGEKDLARFQNVAKNTDVIADLLQAKSALEMFGKQNAIQSNSNFVNTLKLIEDKIEDSATVQSKVVLPRIESYDAIHGKLEESRKALNQAGRADLEKLFVAALERVERDYQRLQTESNEKPLLMQIEAVRTDGISLKNLLENSERVAEIAGNNSSENVERAAQTKQNRLNEQIKNLRLFVEKLSDRVDVISDIEKGENLQREIYQNQSKYENTPEAEKIVEYLDKLTAKIKELKEERRRRKAEEDERIRRESEKATVQNIVAQFNRLSDANQRFECLQQLVRDERKTNLTREQIQKITDILWEKA